MHINPNMKLVRTKTVAESVYVRLHGTYFQYVVTMLRCVVTSESIKAIRNRKASTFQNVMMAIYVPLRQLTSSSPCVATSVCLKRRPFRSSISMIAFLSFCFLVFGTSMREGNFFISRWRCPSCRSQMHF